MSLDSGDSGQELDLGRWIVDRRFTDEYLGAVEDGSSIYAELGVAPPMALAARALGNMLDVLSLPPGTIHAAQELECGRLVKLGEEVSCVARVSRPRRQGGWRFISADFAVRGQDAEAALRGKITVLVPEGEMGGE